ncbi:CRISPR-associated protein Cse4 [Bifidobacterium italicum]|uniref:CRISPR-associated protein Cse4 n=1 Tax=Bifidobacterium italicum TaxID=1960968 RepID=A0A2A2EF37_9BIFI|nr:type I-E CRISPR-associated protein Cas7/Cse4/CasC [Bifidobacterium italicum]PAU67577.1 CRISPR-associated protein Cse4 [Bifidobacterium italicum]
MSYLDVHIIQNVPASNINRDDTGNPKVGHYGGKLRARVSSQSWKRAMREMFPTMLKSDELGVRTKMAASLIAEAIGEKRPDLASDAATLAKAVLGSIGVEIKESKRSGADAGRDATSYLIFIAHSEIQALADLAIQWADDGQPIGKPTKEMKAESQAAFYGKQAIDIALFGRMLADAPALNTDASSQVAHAISVDQITPEYDYYTAIDDCASKDNAGAAMLDTVGFNSSTLYRYANVNIDSLRKQLGDDAAAVQGIVAFVEAFVRSMPTGKQNTFANRTLPSVCVAMIRDDQPINAVNAFEKPVYPKDDASITEQAAVRLGAHLRDLQDTYGETPERSWVMGVGDLADKVGDLGEAVTLPELHDRLERYLTEMFEG